MNGLNLSIMAEMTYQDKIAHMFDWSMDAPLYSSLIIIAIILVLVIIVGIQARRSLKKKDYLNKPHGLLMLGEWFVEFCDKFVEDNMGPGFERFGGYFMGLILYLGMGFVWGITGLPSVIDWLAAPLSLAIIMFVLIHFTAIRYQHFSYLHRYVEPFAIFLPVNLITMWSPIISTAMRMFGNCLSGTIIIGLVQWSLGRVSGAIFGSLTTAAYANYWPNWDLNQNTVWTQIFFAPLFMGVLNLYFSLFSAFIQTTVFVYLNALWIAQEKPVVESVPGAVGEKLEPKTSVA